MRWLVLLLLVACDAPSRARTAEAEADAEVEQILDAAVDGAVPDAVAPAEATPLAEYWQPDAWVEPECPAGQFATVAGCSAPWPCPEGWSRGEGGLGCTPPALPDCSAPLPDGSCVEVPCKAGWARRADGTCLPEIADCAHGVVVPGGCLEPPDCMAPDWPAGAAFVVQGAPQGGDGTAARPYAGLDEAFAAGEALVALERGAYAWPGAAPAGVRIVGRCPSETRLVDVSLSDSATIEGVTLAGVEGSALRSLGGAIELRDVELTGGEPLVEALAGELALERAWLHDGGSVLISGGAVRLSVSRADRLAGRVVVAVGADLTLDRVALDRIEQVRIEGTGQADRVWILDASSEALLLIGGRADLRRVWIDRPTRPNDRFGIGVSKSARMTLDGATIRGGTFGIVVVEWSVATISDSTVGPIVRGEGSTQAGIGALQEATLDLRDVRITSAPVAGLLVSQSVVDIDGLAVDGTFGAESSNALQILERSIVAGRRLALSGTGLGLSVVNSSVADLRWLSAVGNFEPAGLILTSAATLRDVVLSSRGEEVLTIGWIEPRADIDVGTSDVTVERALLETHAPMGKALLACEARIALRDVAIRGADRAIEIGRATLDAERVIAESVGTGLRVSGDVDCAVDPTPPTATHARVSGLVVQSPQDTGVYADDGAEVELEDLSVLSGPAVGVSVATGARLQITGGRLEALGRAALVARGEGTRLGARDLVVRAMTGEIVDGRLRGEGLLAENGAEVGLDRVRIEGAIAQGVGLTGSALTATDLAVVDTRPDPDGASGSGLVSVASRLDLARVHLTRNAAFGALAQGSQGVLSDLVITDTRADVNGGIEGRGFGLGLFEGNTLTVEGARLEGNRLASLFISGSSLRGRRIAVLDTHPDRGLGVGIDLTGAGRLELADFRLEGHPTAAIRMTDASAHLEQGIIADSGVGLLRRLVAQVTLVAVRFVDNAVDEACEGTCLDAPPPVDDP